MKQRKEMVIFPKRDLSQANFLTVLGRNHYPFLGLEDPDKWTQSNKPLSLIWYDAIQTTLALYWFDTLDVTYESLKDTIASVHAEEIARANEYPCGLLTTVVLPVMNFSDLRHIDPALFNADDLIGLVFYGNFVVNLDKLEEYFEDAKSENN